MECLYFSGNKSLAFFLVLLAFLEDNYVLLKITCSCPLF